MAQSGDPQSGDDHDDLIGFASPQSLRGQPRATASAPEPASAPQPPQDEPDLFAPAPAVSAPVIQPRWGAPAAEPELEPAPEPEIAPDSPHPEATSAPPPEPRPVVRPDSRPEALPEPRPERRPDPRTDFATPEPPRWSARDAVAPAIVSAGAPVTGAEDRSPAPRTAARAEAIEGQTGLFTIYALILLIVPTLGVSGAIALFAIMGRAAPTSSSALSHHVYQKRTLLIGVGVAVAGVLLMVAPFALGVIALFGLALWLIVRGAWGLWCLKAGLPISSPRGFWI